MRRTGPAAERFVNATLELIEEQGGLQNVNLREVARRVGIAHTNVYHYFDGWPGLIWETVRRAVAIYGDALGDGLADDMAPLEYYRRFIENVIAFPQDHPGLARLILSDPLADDDIPAGIYDTVAALMGWAVDVIHACAPGSTAQEAADAHTIILGYLNGESLALINGRYLPGDDLPGRMLEHSLRLFTLLTGFDGSVVEPQRYPRLELPQHQERN